MTILIGADPELFLTIGGKAITAAGLFPGTKKDPFKVDKGAIQVDGNALEFNIDAASNEDEFSQNINIVLGQMKEMARIVDKDIQFNFVPYMEFDKEYWETRIDDEAKILGCDPDYSAIADGVEVNPNPQEVLQNLPVRTAAGHIHIGWTHDRLDDIDHFDACKFVANGFHRKGVFAPITELERKRLNYYGANGAFRPKSYGVEIREPSNGWVEFAETRKETFRKTRSTFAELTGL